MGHKFGFGWLMPVAAAMLAVVMLGAPAQAQLGLPSLPEGGIGRALDPLHETLADAGRGVEGIVDQLAADRLDRIAALVRRNPHAIALDDNRQPARAGEVLLLDPDRASLGAARQGGFATLEEGRIDGLDMPFARLALPEGTELADGLRALRRLLPGKELTADHLHFTSGEASGDGKTEPPSTSQQPRGGTVGIIDGGISPAQLPPAVHASQQGFAHGAPRPGQHGSAIASLLAGAGTDRILAADVYGDDPAGGDALGIARALGWMAGQGVGVVSISLTGPPNPLLARAIAAAQARGMMVVAAVGNDGAAAPPAYPASYPDVIAVTGVDARGRVLIEAGRAGHLDYAAPGADISAVGLGGRRTALRGTSFAAPLVAARIAAHMMPRTTGRSTLLAAINIEAAHRGSAKDWAKGWSKGWAKDWAKDWGRGLLCDLCRRGL